MNRRKAVAGSLLVQAGLGSIMSWAMLFTSARGRAGEILSPGFQSEYVFTAGLLAFAVAVLIAGGFGEKVGARKLAAASGILLGAGYFLTLFLNISALEQASLITGVLGAAAGIVYIASIDIGMKWYPEKKGIVTGLVLAASGFGGLCWFRVQEILVARFSLQDALLVVGSSSALLVLAGSFKMSEPPAGYVPPVWKKPENPLADMPPAPDELKNILCRPAFYIIAGSLILVSTAAIFFSGNLQYVCNKILTAKGLETQLACRIALLAAAIFAISDGLGRIAWGAIADGIGFKLSIVILCAVETILIVLISKLGGNGSVLIFGTFIIGTAMGGILTIFPCLVVEYIGEQDFFKTYSLMFACFLIIASGIIQVSGFLRESFGANAVMWLNSLFFSGALPLAGGAVMLLLKKSGRRGAVQKAESSKEDSIPGEMPETQISENGPEDENKDNNREEDEAIQQHN